MKINTDQLANLTLRRGYGYGGADGVCLMQAITLITDEHEPWPVHGPISDAPSCVATDLILAGQRLNDTATDEQRSRLKTLIPRLIGTRDDGLDDVRHAAALEFRDEIRMFWLTRDDGEWAIWGYKGDASLVTIINWATLGSVNDLGIKGEAPGWELAYRIFDRVLRAGETLINDEAFGVSAVMEPAVCPALAAV